MTAAAPAVASAPGAARPVTPVAIAAGELTRIVERAAGPGAELPADLLADLRRVRDLVAGLDPYLEAMTTPESAALAALARRSNSHDWNAHRAAGGAGAAAGLEQEMLSGHVEGAFLRMLVAITGARSVLDVGMFTGYSALAMAEALPGDGRLVACELDPAVAALARDAFTGAPAGGRIDVRVGRAADTLAALAAAGERFDLVFVDADKGGYRDYVDTLLATGLLAPRGVLAVDNTLLQGLPWVDPQSTPNAAAITAFNETLAADPRVEQVLLPLRDGITLVRRADPAVPPS